MKYDNAYIFSFSNDYNITTNLDNYKDIAHYGENINSYILEKMSRGQNRLTKNNYNQYLDDIYKFYSNYDYEKIYK